MPAPRWVRLVFEQFHPATVQDLPSEIQTALARADLPAKPYQPLVIELDRAHAIKVLGVIFDQIEADLP